MAPLKPVKKDGADKRLQRVLDVASRAHQLLHDRAPIPLTLSSDIENTAKQAFPLHTSVALVGKAPLLDSLGSQLWNAATNLIREQEHQNGSNHQHYDGPRLAVLLRTFAFLLVDAAHHASSRRAKDHDQRVRSFKIANKAAKFCLERDDLELALKVFERSAEYVSQTEEDAPIVRIAEATDGRQDELGLTLQRLTCEYYLLRMTHSWRSDRFDMADHFFSKVNPGGFALSASLAEQAADLLHEAGKSLAAKHDEEAAARWCEKALSALDAVEPEDLTPDVTELRLAIVATLVAMLLARPGNAGNYSRASAIVEELDSTYGMGNRMAVCLMRFEILTSLSPVNAEELDSILRQLITLTVITDKTFKTIMRTIHKARRCSALCSLTALQYLSNFRLVPDIAAATEPNDTTIERLEKVVVTYIVFATSATDKATGEAAQGLRNLLDDLQNRGSLILSAKATHAAQTLIWKRTGSCELAGAEDWLQLLRHPIFDNAGQLNKARIGRKAIVAALLRDDIHAAREAFYSIPQATQNDGKSRYLAFRIALKSNDHELAQESLQIITKHADKDATHLYACVLEAQQSDARYLAVAAMQSLLDKQPPGIHLPSLLRCTMRLLIGELETPEHDPQETMEEVVLVFERAASKTLIFRQGNDQQWRAEIQWWSKTAYNLALRLCDAMRPEQLVRLLATCMHFLDCYPDNGGIMHAEDLLHRKSVCLFTSSCALVVSARSAPEDSDCSKQSYLKARKEIAGFKDCVSKLEQIRSSDAKTDGEATSRANRLFELLKYDFEAIIRLRQWQELHSAVQTLLNFSGGDRWDILADLALIFREQATAADVDNSANSRIPQLLEKCVNETWKKDRDIVKMSRWLRLTFNIHLEDDEGGLALKIVQQAAGIARKGYDGQEQEYPGDELVWLATTAFNRALDALSAGDNGGYTTWSDGALELARYSGDNGALHADLTHRRRVAEERSKARQ